MAPATPGIAVSAAGLTGIVLAGGGSRRMGTDKALVEIDGIPMLRRVVEALRASCGEVLIVAKDPARYTTPGARLVEDASPIQAPLVGVCAGLRAAAAPRAFVAACDLPYLSPAAVRLLATLAEGYDAAAPYVRGRWHPLHAVYARGAAPALEARLAAGALRLTDALEALRVRRVGAAELRAADPTLRTLRNVNTPRDVAAASKAGLPGGGGELRRIANGRRTPRLRTTG